MEERVSESKREKGRGEVTLGQERGEERGNQQRTKRNKGAAVFRTKDENDT